MTRVQVILKNIGKIWSKISWLKREYIRLVIKIFSILYQFRFLIIEVDPRNFTGNI